MRHHEDDERHYCALDTRCRDYNPVDKHAGATTARDPLCDTELAGAHRAIRMLPYDYLDLAQLQEPSLSQALDTQRRGDAGPPILIRGEPEALQAEIVYVTDLWAEAVRERHRLSRKRAPYLVGAWHTTVSNRPPAPRRRPGGEVQRNARVLTIGVRSLARIEAHLVYPSGLDDDPVDMNGWEAVMHLRDLHDRARSMLGRTKRKFWVPGECWQEACADAHQRAVARGADQTQWLWRSEPDQFEDELQVHCIYCDEPRAEREYLAYVEMLVWPARHVRGEVA